MLAFADVDPAVALVESVAGTVMEPVGWTMLELGRIPVLTGTGGCDWGVTVDTRIEVILVELALLMGAIEGMIVGSLIVETTEVVLAELEADADVVTAAADVDTAAADVDTTEADFDTAELEPVAEVLPGAWIWPSLIWETVAPFEVTEPTGLEMPNWVEYWYCPVPLTMICRP